MHHEGFVEARMLHRIAPVSNMNERGLRERSQQLVRRRCREDRRTLVVCRISVHAIAILVDRIEAGVAVPRFIKVNAVHALAEQIQDSLAL